MFNIITAIYRRVKPMVTVEETENKCPSNPVIKATLDKILCDGEVHTRKSLKEAVIEELDLTQEQIEERIPSGKATKLDTRIGLQVQNMVNEGRLVRCAKGEVQLKQEEE
jgi:restriction endonuclease Mrr